MDLKSRIKSLFHEGVLTEKASISNILGKKKVLKGLGRKGLKKSKVKSKRKNNYKTQDARRILASKHGLSQALKKEKNKYIMTYDEIAKAMRKHNYTFNKDHGKWFRKKDKGGATKSDTPTSSYKKPEETNDAPKASKKAKVKVEKPEDLSDKLKSDKESSIKPLDIANDQGESGNYLNKESMKSYQARMIAYLLNQNTEEGGWNDAIQIIGTSDKLEFYLPKEKIYEFLDAQQVSWIEERKVWIDIDGDYPVPENIHGGRQGITGRANLANDGFVNFLDLEDTSDQESLDTLTELGYNWGDGMWKKPEIVENVQKRVFPELVTQDIIGHI